MKLELSWVSILHPFDNRLKWADALCKTRNIVFELSDSISVGMLGNNSPSVRSSPHDYRFLHDIEGKLNHFPTIIAAITKALFVYVLVILRWQRRIALAAVAAV